MRLSGRGSLFAVSVAVALLLNVLDSLRLPFETASPAEDAGRSTIGGLFITPAEARRNSRGKDRDGRDRSDRRDDRRDGRRDQDRGFDDDGRGRSSGDRDSGQSRDSDSPAFDTRGRDRQWSDDGERRDRDGGETRDRDRDRDRNDDGNERQDGPETSDRNDTPERDGSPGEDGDRRNRGDRADETEPSSEPPATVEGLLQTLTQTRPVRDRKSRRPPDLRITSDTAVADDSILATGMSESDLQRARDLGFDAETMTGAAGGPRVIRLVARHRNGRGVAGELLKELVVRGGFHKNYRYVIYAPADDSGSHGPDDRPEPGARTGQCRDDRCFGRAAICWTTDLERRTGGLKIGIIDTPVDLDHPAFAGRRLRVGNFLGSYRRSPQDWHGTAVLALLSGNAENGVPGLAPDAEYFVAETFRTDDRGQATTDTVSILKALEWLESQNVDLVNMSFSGPRDQFVETAIRRLRKRGMTFVAAAGNLGPTAGPSYPAAYADVIAVTAIAKDRANYPMANRGDFVDVSAPGVKIWTALPGGLEGFRTGTSFASPFVTGLLAAVLTGKARPSTKTEVLRRLETIDLGPPGNDPIFGRGLAVAPGGCGSTESASSAPPRDPTRAMIAAPPDSFGETLVIPSPSAASAFAP
ncbi:MAG: S8 family serine peptidase [Hyphomicrobium sp.]